MKNRKKVLLLVLLLMIGFASVSATLVINGTIGITKNNGDFNIIFTDAKLDGKRRKDFIDSETKQTINYVTEKLTKINETTTLEYDVANTSKIYDGEVSISCNIVDESDQPTTSEYIEMEYTPASMTVHAGETKSGSITAKLIKGSTEDKSIKVKCTLNANAIERESLGDDFVSTYSFPEGYVLKDANDNGVADIGEEIKVGTEYFYVISRSDLELRALAKYNLNVGDNKNPDVQEGIQHETVRGYVSGITTYGNVKFVNTAEWWQYKNYAKVDIESYEGPVKDALYGTNGYENYIKQTINTATVHLITKTDLERLGCSTSDYSCALAPDWVKAASYWTECAHNNSSAAIMSVLSNEKFGPYAFDNNENFGVRPVIAIPLESTKEPGTYELTVDADSDGVIDIGDEIQIGTESFYVISNTNTELKALAKYNLNVGGNQNLSVTEGIQHETVIGNHFDFTKSYYGNVRFSNNNNWEQGATVDIKQFNGPAKDALYGTNGYENYLKQTINNISVNLITKEELAELLDIDVQLSNFREQVQTKGYLWIYSTAYWTRSVNSGGYTLKCIGLSGNISMGDFHNGGEFGIRPVVTIPKP